MSTSYTITGAVHEIQDAQTFASGFTKQIAVIMTERDSYPQTVPIEFIKENTALISGLVKGQEVEIEINIRGNEWKGRYFPCLQGWKLKAGVVPEAEKPEPANNDDLMGGSDLPTDDQLPF